MALRRNRFLVLAGTAGLLTVGFSAGPAQAAAATAVAEVYGGGSATDFFVYAGGDQRNQVEVTLERNADESQYFYTVDDVVEIEAGPQCTHPDGADLTKVSCTVNKRSTGYVQGNVILGGGDDSATYGGGFYAVFTDIHLGTGNDTYLTGDPQGYEASRILGDDGNDTIAAGYAADVVAGAGDDVISLTGAYGTVDGGAGADRIDGGVGGDTLTGGDGVDIIRGNAGDDQITGGAGNDELAGGAGDDVVRGDAGDDQITGGAGNDTLYGGSDNDTIYGNSGNDTIYGNSGDDYISGGAGTDTLSGGAGTNTVIN